MSVAEPTTRLEILVDLIARWLIAQRKPLAIVFAACLLYTSRCV